MVSTKPMPRGKSKSMLKNLGKFFSKEEFGKHSRMSYYPEGLDQFIADLKSMLLTSFRAFG